MYKISVLLVDDHTIVRQGIRRLLEDEPDINVVGEAETGREAVEMAAQLLPDVAVMDISMPNLDGIEATRQITREQSSTRVLVLSGHRDVEYVERLTEAGAAGYLVKQSSMADLVEGIREIHRGNGYLSPCISKQMLDRCRQSYVQGPSTNRLHDELTPREREVVQLIAKSRANKQVAAELGISIKTVEKHRQQVMNKLNIHDTAGLTRYALSRGLLSATEPVMC